MDCTGTLKVKLKNDLCAFASRFASQIHLRQEKLSSPSTELCSLASVPSVPSGRPDCACGPISFSFETNFGKTFDCVDDSCLHRTPNRPISVQEVVVSELNEDGSLILDRTVYERNFAHGDEAEYKSFASRGATPSYLSFAMTGRNVLNQRITNTFTVELDPFNCSQPKLREGDQLGWLVFVSSAMDSV